jgi:hypothetical protein
MKPMDRKPALRCAIYTPRLDRADSNRSSTRSTISVRRPKPISRASPTKAGD